MNAEPPPDRGESTNMDAPNATTSAPVTPVMADHGHRPVTGRETTMQAIVQDRYGSADVLELADIDQPVPADNEVLMQMVLVGSCASAAGAVAAGGARPAGDRL